MTNQAIKDVFLSRIFNSRGEPSVKVSILTESGLFSSCAPHGASSGKYEAKNLEVAKIEKTFPKFRKNFIGLEADFSVADEMLEQFGGKDFAKIGGNFSIALSQAVCKASSQNNPFRLFGQTKYFPFPLGNVLGGGAHGGGTDMQEFLVIPIKAKTIQETAETNFAIWRRAESALKAKGFVAGRNDEGALVSRLNDLKTIDLLSDIAEDFGARIGIDFAASELYGRGQYVYGKLGKRFSAGEQLEFVAHLIKTYRLAYVEDPFQQNDFESFAALAKKVKCIICGDDLFASHPDRLKKGIRTKAGNAVILKPNQAGTVSKILEAAELAKKDGFTPVVSHRSGDTCDSFISDLAVGIGAPLIKCGIMGSERTAKINRLIEIWNQAKRPEMARLKI
ncbi:MAG: enolase C-terminal domain-like protein [Candidatus Aenigmatarchaeota archaeon]